MRWIAGSNAVAVGACALNELGADRSTRARAIVHHDRLPEAFRESLTHDPSHDVHTAAWRIRHHEPHRFEGIDVALRCLRSGDTHDQE